MAEFSESQDPLTMGELPEVTYHNPTENVDLPEQEKNYKYDQFTMLLISIDYFLKLVHEKK